MSDAALSLPFVPPGAAEPGEALLLEQEEWKRSTGLLTRLNALRHISRRAYQAASVAGGESAALMDCGVTSEGVVIELRVYPLREAAFRLAASIGELGEPRREDIEEEAAPHYTLTSEATLSHPARRVLSATWLTGPYNAQGVRIAPPPLAVDGRTLRVVGDVVYGSVRVKTLVRRWTAALTVPWEEAEASLNAGWGEWAAAFPDGGKPVALERTAPPGAAEMAASGGGCGASYRVKKAEGAWPPECPPADKRVDCDYCKGECDDGYRP